MTTPSLAKAAPATVHTPETARVMAIRAAADRAKAAAAERVNRGPEWTHFQKEIVGVLLYLLRMWGPKPVRGKFGLQDTLTCELASLDGQVIVVPIRGAAWIDALTEPAMRELVELGGRPAVLFEMVEGTDGQRYYRVRIDFDGDMDALRRSGDVLAPDGLPF